MEARIAVKSGSAGVICSETHWPSRSLPYVSKDEACVIVLTLQLEPKSNRPFSYAFRCYERKHATNGRGVCLGRLPSRPVVHITSKEQFQSADASSRRVEHLLINALFHMLDKVKASAVRAGKAPRAFVCVYSPREAQALSNLLLSTILEDQADPFILARAVNIAHALGFSSDD